MVEELEHIEVDALFGGSNYIHYDATEHTDPSIESINLQTEEDLPIAVDLVDMPASVGDDQAGHEEDEEEQPMSPVLRRLRDPDLDEISGKRFLIPRLITEQHELSMYNIPLNLM